MIQAPVRPLTLKKRSHYVCDERLMHRLQQVDLERKNLKAAQALLSLRDQFDVDQVPHLSPNNRRRYVSHQYVTATGAVAGTSAI